MARVICHCDCKYRSKHPLRKYVGSDGHKLYGCTKDFAVINLHFDPDRYIEQVIGRDGMSYCMFYEPSDQPIDEIDK